MIQTAIHSFLPREISAPYLTEHQPKNQRIAMIAAFVLMVVAFSSLLISLIDFHVIQLNAYNTIYLLFGTFSFLLFFLFCLGYKQKKPFLTLATLITVQAMMVSLTYYDILAKQSIIAIALSSLSFAVVYQFHRLTYIFVYILPYGILITALLIQGNVYGFYYMELTAAFTVSIMLAFIAENFRRESFYKTTTIQKQMAAIKQEKTKNQRLLSKLTETNKQLKQQVKDRTKAEKVAQKASAAKSQFLANMSHELRTPLNGISGALHLLQSSTSEKDRQNVIEIGLTSINALTRIINDILDLSKIESGKFTLINSPANPMVMIKRLERTYSLLAGEKAINLTVHADETCDQTIILDHVRLEQICANLLSNAIKFTKEGSVTLTVRCTAHSDTECSLAFDITDTGIGISAADQEKLFTNFEQLHQEENTVHQGTGLGLAISKQLTEMMGGNISVASTPGKGATFSFNVTGSIQLPQQGSEQKGQTPEKETTYHIILAEDLRINQMIIKKLLHVMGHHVLHVCTTGQEVLDYLDELRGKNKADFAMPDLILMDNQMPEMNGIRATQLIRQRQDQFQHIPIIALTADAFAEDRVKFEQVGMDGFISKPIDPQRVALELDRVMQNKD